MSAEIRVDEKKKLIIANARPVQPSTHCHLFPETPFKEIDPLKGMIIKGANM